MTAQRVTVPDGKRVHIGVLVGTRWAPICGQVSFFRWLPGDLGFRGRRVAGPCSKCVRTAAVIADIGNQMAEVAA